MNEKRFTSIRKKNPVSKKMGNYIQDNGTTILKLSSFEDCKDVCEVLNEQYKLIIDLTENLSVTSNREIRKDIWIEQLQKENERLKAQLYCDDEEGVCNICKHHYLVKDNETELGYYNSRCRKGHYECARVSLKHCEDFEKELEE